MQEILERFARPEERSILAVLAIIVGYGLWGLASGFRRKRVVKPAPADE